MRILWMCGTFCLFSSLLLAQQPVATGKLDRAARNYEAGDGSTLSKNSTDDDVARALRQALANDPELSGVQVQVKHHQVTIMGSVPTKDARERAYTIAQHLESVRSVRDRVRLGEPSAGEKNSVVSTAH